MVIISFDFVWNEIGVVCVCMVDDSDVGEVLLIVFECVLVVFNYVVDWLGYCDGLVFD